MLMPEDNDDPHANGHAPKAHRNFCNDRSARVPKSDQDQSNVEPVRGVRDDPT